MSLNYVGPKISNHQTVKNISKSKELNQLENNFIDDDNAYDQDPYEQKEGRYKVWTSSMSKRRNIRQIINDNKNNENNTTSTTTRISRN